MPIQANSKSVSVGTSLVTISEQKTTRQRVRFVCTNTSTASQVISIAVDDEAVASSGIVLYAGGSFTLEVQSNLPLNQGRITAIASAVSGTLAVYEEVL